MPSRFLRRSGVAVCLCADLLNWRPSLVVQVGIGFRCEEIDVMRQAWPNVHFVGIEPHPQSVATMRSAYPGVILQCAAGEVEGEATLFSKRLHKDGSSLFERRDRNPNNPSYKVRVCTLDSLMGHDHSGVLLWLDCEGSELGALRGGLQFLNGVEVINVERTSKAPAGEWAPPLAVHKLLKSRGFKQQWIHTQRMGDGQVDAIYVRPYLFRPEYCCCPCELEEHPEIVRTS